MNPTYVCRCCIWLLLSGLVVATTGCEPVPYLLQLAEGHFGSQAAAEPIDEVLASGRLSAEDRAKLELAVAAREFAVEQIGLNAGTSYTTFFDTAGEPLAYSLSASRKDALEQFSWYFPIVGEVPQLTIFDKAYLDGLEAMLQEAGYDTFMYELDAYSSMGILEDPIRSTMLKRSDLSVAETIIHELLHNTIWRVNEQVFNESLANYVGRQGAQEFLRDYFGADSDWATVAPRYYADLDQINTFLWQLYNDLEAYYAQPISGEEKIAGREAIFEAARQRFVNEIQPALNYPDVFAGYANLPTNNAYMLIHRRYNLDLGVMGRVYEATDRDWSAALEIFRAAATTRQDPFEYLREWVADHASME